jgi:hypothetical protein
MKRIPLVLALTSACTLFGFAELALVECPSNATCAPLNQAHGLDVTTAAEVYQCASDRKGCVLSPTDWDDDGALAMGPEGERDCDDAEPLAFPGGAESCDLVDNDCDGAIDEGVYGGAPLPPALSLGRVLSVDFGSLTTGADAQSLDLTVVASGQAPTLEDEPPPGLGRLHVVSALDRPPTSLEVSSDDARPSNCPLSSDETALRTPCYPASIATDGESSAVRLAAAIERNGCPAGRVRFGSVEDLLRVPADAGLCGGAFPFVSVEAGEARCTARDQVYGAQRVELAQLPTHGEAAPAQALAAWIGTHALGHDACGVMNNTPVPADPVDSLSRTAVGVAAMGFWVDAGPETLSTTGSEGLAQPALLGFTRGGSAPAIEPLLLPDGSEHYIVAFGTEQGPSLRAVERVATPATMCGESELPALRMRSADPWNDAAQTHAAADQLVVAKGPVLADACGTQRTGARLGLAWVERCGQPDAELWFATVDFSPSTGFCNPSVPQQATRFDHAVLLGQPGARLEPVLAHVPHAISRSEALGGFVLAWIEGQGGVRARRASAERGTFIDQAIDLGVTGARALGARRLGEGALELAIVRAASGDALELVQKRLSGGCGG